MRLMVGFCNQLMSPAHAAGLIDEKGTGWRWLPMATLDIPPGGNGGLCGACRLGDDIIIATQTTPPRLARFDTLGNRFSASCALPGCVDVHSVTVFDGALYVASTGTNEIYRIPVGEAGFGPPQLHWRYPGVGNDADHVHLNGITATPDGLIATCFGPRRSDSNWGEDGSIFLLNPFIVIQDQLRHPHSPLCCGERLFFTESLGHRVHTRQRIGAGQWQSEPPIDVGGYARGLAHGSGRLWVGVSAERQVSRSRKTLNTAEVKVTSAQIVVIDLATRTVEERRTLTGLGEEIFDLMLMTDAEALTPLTDSLGERIAEMQRIGTILRLDIEAAQAAHRDEQARMDELSRALIVERNRAERSETLLNDALIVERSRAERAETLLTTVARSRLWRTAQRLRRLLGRERLELGIARPTMPDLLRHDSIGPSRRRMAETFREIYVANAWGNAHSRSGAGSDLAQTSEIRAQLPRLMSDLGIASMLDLPCGDFHWMSELALDLDYIGGDVVPDIIASNVQRFATPRRRFRVLDATVDPLPKADLILCRDLLVHLAFEDAIRAIVNFRSSRSRYLLTTTFTRRTENTDIPTGQWRPINLERPPFAFPPPLRLINEHCSEGDGTWTDKSLALWDLSELRI